jgi:SOS-response transcriptional repressor LexA
MTCTPTESQLKWLRAIHSLTKRYGYPPTIREILAELGHSSLNADTLVRLERDGWLTRNPRLSRTTRLTPAALEVIK